MLRCPHSFETIVELGLPGKRVSWSEPYYYRLATNVERSHERGDEFPVGVTWVNYTFEDQYDNVATCNFSITVLEGKTMTFPFYQASRRWYHQCADDVLPLPSNF